MAFRHEVKQEIGIGDLLVLRQRLSAIMQPDEHAVNGCYEVSSLYFDNADDAALREKNDGVNKREKFRIRCYNADTSFICLEKKRKVNDLTAKEDARITLREARDIINGEIDWMAADRRPLITELYSGMRARGLKPKTVVAYTREPFVFAPGNVRVTLDHHIRTGLSSIDLFSPSALTIPAGDETIILEVKWDGFLPEIIREAVNVPAARSAAFSKYARCRIYG